jgi:hypothetical protein
MLRGFLLLVLVFAFFPTDALPLFILLMVASFLVWLFGVMICGCIKSTSKAQEDSFDYVPLDENGNIDWDSHL